VDLRKLNDACVHDPFPTLFTDKVLDEVLPDTQLFVVHIADGHFEDIIHSLSTGTALD